MASLMIKRIFSTLDSPKPIAEVGYNMLPNIVPTLLFLTQSLVYTLLDFYGGEGTMNGIGWQQSWSAYTDRHKRGMTLDRERSYAIEIVP